MLKKRAWGVTTATAQMEIIGRRHYGRKAVAPGGDGAEASSSGSRGQQRTLFDTLLTWQPRVLLDENGQATVTVPLNDSLTRFEIVAVAEHGVNLFGTGRASLTVSQDLQLISGLPPLVRAGDHFVAQVTLRNTTTTDMQVSLSARADWAGEGLAANVTTASLSNTLSLPTRQLRLAAGQAQQVNWPVKLHALTPAAEGALTWDIQATAKAVGLDSVKDRATDTIQDRIKIGQRIVPSVPLAVLQGTLVQLDASYHIPVALPSQAIAQTGGLRLSLAPTLATGSAALHDWWQRYPYICLEQGTSKAVGLQDIERWQSIMQRLSVYLDRHGLASYFPIRSGYMNRGSDTLTAHLLNLSAQMQQFDARFVIPEAERRTMQQGLLSFLQGRVATDGPLPAPKRDLDVRKLAAMQALAVSDAGGEYSNTLIRAIDAIRIAPNEWPTHAVIDWVSLLQALPQTITRAQHIRQAQQILRARLNYQGTRAGFSNEDDDDWWWLMHSADTNLARLILLNLDAPDWQADMPRLVSGFIARQQHGAWRTTTANLWGGLALQRFSQHFEATPVTGTTVAQWGTASASVQWADVTPITQAELQAIHAQHDGIAPLPVPGSLKNNTMNLPWRALDETGEARLTLTQQGTGKPWVTLQSVAAVTLTAPVNSGYRINRRIQPIVQHNPNLPPGHYSRGDILRITLAINASADMSWVAMTDPIPAGATILGSGLGRDSQIATAGESSAARGQIAWIERSFESWRGYYAYLPRGATQVQYTVRLNQTGEFTLPPTRIEALYAPEMYGMAPNEPLVVLEAGEE